MTAWILLRGLKKHNYLGNSISIVSFTKLVSLTKITQEPI